jgi:MoxR-like ATPase
MLKVQDTLALLHSNIEKVIVGKPEVVDLAIVTLLCRGHLLIEDVPGLGKTMLARSIASSLALRFKRVQFTPDLLPSDITGVSIFNQKENEFEFKAGPVFANILLGDEINRATPRTQSSLLECMEERQVTADGQTYTLPPIFMVIATQNPIELQGTYPLPEAQLDRFFMKIGVGYPTLEQEVRILEMQMKKHPIQSISAVVAEEELAALQEAVSEIYIDRSVMEYIIRLVGATRQNENLILGASPRGSLSLMRASQAIALLKGLSYVDPLFVKMAARPVLAHRLMVRPQSRLKGVTAEKIVEEVLNTVPAPVKTDGTERSLFDGRRP